MSLNKYKTFKSINDCMRLQEDVEELIENNFSYLLDALELYTELYNVTSGTMRMDLEFFSKSDDNKQTWDNVKYDLVTLIDMLKEMCGSGMKLVISGSEVIELNLDTFVDDITKVTFCKDVRRIVIKITINLEKKKEKETFTNKFKDFIKSKIGK